MTPSHHLDQHRAALPAADAFGGDAAPGAEPLHRIDEMQHDAVAAAADGMTEADRAAIDIELGAVDLRRRRRRGPESRGRISRRSRRRGSPAPAWQRPRSIPRSRCRASDSLLRFRQFGRRQHRPETHDARDRAPTIGCRRSRPSASGRVWRPPLPRREWSSDAPSVICEELPAVTWPQGRSNTGFSFASVSGEESGRTPSS